VEDEMTTRLAGALVTVILLAATARAQTGEPGRCPNDSKLLNGGPTLVEGEGPGTWWGLVIDGLNAAGFVTDEQKVDYLEQIFGRQFASLDDARLYNLSLLEATFDLNQNGYVCAFELRGTRAYSGDPLIDITTFGVGDDKIAKK
jgi:hypothetical protein